MARLAYTERPSGIVLCIDDNQDVLECEKAFLESFGYTVLTAPSGGKGLELASIHAVDVVIVDYFMPEMDGGEVFQRLRAVNPDVKVIVSTGCDCVLDVDAILRQGATGFIQKPFRIAELAEAVSEAVGGGK